MDMFILIKWELDCEGYFNISTSLAVSADKSILETHFNNNHRGYVLIDDTSNKGHDLKKHCKDNGINYYSVASYYTVETIPFIK